MKKPSELLTDFVPIKFVTSGRCLVQKNRMEIYKKKVGGKLISFIGHSKEFKQARDELAVNLFSQFQKQGFLLPVGSLFQLDCKFFVTKQHEPDLDNLPAIFLDAFQGVSVQGNVVAKVIENDRLLRKLTVEKFIVSEDKMGAELILSPYQESLNEAD